MLFVAYSCVLWSKFCNVSSLSVGLKLLKDKELLGAAKLPKMHYQHQSKKVKQELYNTREE